MGNKQTIRHRDSMPDLHYSLPVLQEREELGDEGVQVRRQQILVAVLREVDDGCAGVRLHVWQSPAEYEANTTQPARGACHRTAVCSPVQDEDPV